MVTRSDDLVITLLRGVVFAGLLFDSMWVRVPSFSNINRSQSNMTYDHRYINGKTQYWNGQSWRRLDYEYLGKDVDNLVKMGMARMARCECGILGHNICTCVSDSYRDETSFSRPIGENVYSLHRPKTTLSNSISWKNLYVRWPHNHYGAPSDKVKLDEIVDHCLLEPIIEIEASL